MLAGVKRSVLSAAGTATDAASSAADRVAEHVADAKASASEHTLTQLQQALEGSREKMSDEPEVYVTIVKVGMQDGMKVDDLFDFRLSGLKCRVRLEVKGTVAQLAAMVAAGAAMGIAGTFRKLTGLSAGGVGKALGGFRSGVAAKAAGGEETKSVEFDINLDLGVRKAGEEVDAVVTIGKDMFGKVNQVVPVSRATAYVQQAIARRVKEIITNWAKKKAKGKAKECLGDTGYEYAKAGVKTTKATYGAAMGLAGRVNEALFEEKASEASDAGSTTSI